MIRIAERGLIENVARSKDAIPKPNLDGDRIRHFLCWTRDSGVHEDALRICAGEPPQQVHLVHTNVKDRPLGIARLRVPGGLLRRIRTPARWHHARRRGCDPLTSFVFADHEAKGAIYNQQEQRAPSAQDLRGSNEKAAFADAVLSVRKKEGSLAAYHTKSRWGKSVAAFRVFIEDVPGQEATTVRGVRYDA